MKFLLSNVSKVRRVQALCALLIGGMVLLLTGVSHAGRRSSLGERAGKSFAALAPNNPRALELSLSEVHRLVIAKYFPPLFLDLHQTVSEQTRSIWLDYRSESLVREFLEEFVTIEAGFLPGNVPVPQFDAAQFPVTREMWGLVMGGMPEHVPSYLRPSWNSCPDCPVTYVSWMDENGLPAEIQDFLATLNHALGNGGCVYDIPTDHQLHYMIRADVTGVNEDQYSNGVTSLNVDSYVFHKGNSDQRIHPVGEKQLNAFKVQLGGVWKITKDVFDIHPGLSEGVRMRGGSWKDYVKIAESHFIGGTGLGHRDDEVGFTLVRNCN